MMLDRPHEFAAKQGTAPWANPGTGLEAAILMGARITFAANAEIFGEDEPAEFIYRVLSGTVRSTKLLSDGRRQIAGFYFAGDFFGLEGGEEHRCSAEAITDCVVLVVKRSALEAMAARDGLVGRELWRLAARNLERANQHLLLLGRKTAQERIASFLLDMASRGHGGNAIELPMSRQDIADYLGLTIETVSRTLTQLENAATIELPTSRRIVLRNRSKLDQLDS